jgi:hypothetical protein
VTMIRDESIQNEAKTAASTQIVISDQTRPLGAVQAWQTLQVEGPSAFTVWTRPNNIAFFTIAGILLHLFLRYVLRKRAIYEQKFVALFFITLTGIGELAG